MCIEIIEFSIKRDVEVFDNCILLSFLKCRCFWINGGDVFKDVGKIVVVYKINFW